MSEYDARSRVPNKEYKDNFDRIFRKPAGKNKKPEDLQTKEFDTPSVVDHLTSSQHGTG